jgi:hypothetical protein
MDKGLKVHAHQGRLPRLSEASAFFLDVTLQEEIYECTTERCCWFMNPSFESHASAPT